MRRLVPCWSGKRQFATHYRLALLREMSVRAELVEVEQTAFVSALALLEWGEEHEMQYRRAILREIALRAAMSAMEDFGHGE